MVIVYSKKQCPQCQATYRHLDRKGVKYQVVDVETDRAAFDQLVAEGYRAMPVVKTENDAWAGFRPDKIDSLAKAKAAALERELVPA